MAAPPPPPRLDAMLAQLAIEPQKRKRHKLLEASRELWDAALVSRLYDEMVRLARVDLQTGRTHGGGGSLGLRAD